MSYTVQKVMNISLRSITFVLVLVLLVFTANSLSPQQAEGRDAGLQEMIKLRIVSMEKAGRVVCSGEFLCGSAVLPEFYKQRDYQAAWTVNGTPHKDTDSLLRNIRAAWKDGFTPEAFHLQRIETLIKKIRGWTTITEPATLVDFDLLMTDSCLLYASTLWSGLVNPETIKAEWFIKSRDIDWPDFLNTALINHTLPASFAGLRPDHAAYRGLKDSLVPLANIADEGGWDVISVSSKLEKGDRGDIITQLYRRLLATEDADDRETSLQDVFDDELEKAVKRFQARHGLETDGVVGKNTLAALNIPVRDRIRQIEANLERWRWLPHSFGSRYIIVNIAGFELDVVENGASVLHMPVVVGKEFTKTPVFDGIMTYLDINPYWNVPHTIAVNEILPNVKKDPLYLEKQEYEVLSGWTGTPVIVPPDSIDWTALNSRNFPYRIRQKPGEKNALGRIKFMFPNSYAIYLHDTPAKSLFERASRSFSHGCIRVSGPVELAEYLLQNNALWSRDSILKAIAGGENLTVNLPQPIPVFLIYITAWADKDGMLHFRDDIYGRDKPLMQALDSLPSIK